MNIIHRLYSVLSPSMLFLFSVIPLYAASPQLNSIASSSAEIGLYEKFELSLNIDASYSNPFNPEEINITTRFTSPSGKEWDIWGFYNPDRWSRLWMVRFSPDEVGTWTYRVQVTDNKGTAVSEEGTFQAVDSPYPGRISIAPNNRYLQHSDGSSFYGVGMWYNDSYEKFNEGRITEQGLDELKKNGANFISFFPTPLETMSTGVGRYDQNRSGRLDQLFEWCEKRDINISWNIWFHSYISETVWGGGNARYRHNPYSLVCEAVDFFTDPDSWSYQEKLYRYMIARWGYSRSLFLWFVVDEIDGTEGWVHGDTTAAAAWSKKVHDYFKENDPYARPTTGTRCGHYRSYWPDGYRIFDIAAREVYEAQAWPIPEEGRVSCEQESPLRYSYSNYAGEIRKMWSSFDKPLMIGECGWDHTYYEPGMPGYLATYHNALWASLAAGLCATPFWWSFSDFINDNVVTRQMLHFREFVSELDFTAEQFSPAEITADTDCDAWAMKSDRVVFGWVVNAKESVANTIFKVSGVSAGEYEVDIYHTWSGRFLGKHIVNCQEGILKDRIPELRIERGHARHIGNDVAFIARKIDR
jgi:uncharacterized protein DUF5060